MRRPISARLPLSSGSNPDLLLEMGQEKGQSQHAGQAIVTTGTLRFTVLGLGAS